MTKSSKSVFAATFSALLLGMLSIQSASAVENSVGWKTSNPGRNDVYDIYEATRGTMPESSGTVEWRTSNPGRTEVFDAYEATRTPTPQTSGAVQIHTTNAHRNDVYDIYRK